MCGRYAQGLIYLLTKPDKAHYRLTELACTAIYFAWCAPSSANHVVTSLLKKIPHLRVLWDIGTALSARLYERRYLDVPRGYDDVVPRMGIGIVAL